MPETGRRVVVTGGGSGIGRAVVEQLADDGARVATLDLRAPAPSPVLPDGVVLPLTCDVADEHAVEAAVEQAAAWMGGVDRLVTCAGVTDGSPTDEMSLGTWRRLLDVNLTGTFLAVRACLPHLLREEAAAVVTVASVGGLVAAGRSAAYDATKGGVVALSRSLAAEYADRGLRVNCVCPGLVATDLAANSAADPAGLSSVPRTAIAGRVTPLLRRPGSPGEIAAMVAFLLSDRAAFTTGASIAVDGGYTAV
ncbi:glucose 1-dehydrogenase [Actinomycetospora corticicola]|uniref:NAD(P)-dependent dehydrogenase (Short-subunit alcohol dehydrogenase family) n=1 Tax=Actinomycetospora corticicola TaxID=663602 RepID=A0A7Y9J530_9PSEU|nr:SDR family NAD(P)-dependent oxidoreductase [Actinomycetospora corticicola]NYD35650.1 NAD(P)-dependent dehydrogenase (short-subunit alcohol dehydrogenase family) [Actinomycetospora corticicola]